MLHLGSFNDEHRGDAPDWPARFAALAARARDPRLKAFYAAGAASGETPIAATPMVAVDVETSGLDAQRDEIVSIGALPMDLACIRASASRHWIVQPRRAMSARAVTLHRITDSQVAAAPDLGEILEPLLWMLAARVVVVHCRAIERSFLAAAMTERLGEGIEFPVIDTMELEARLHRRAPSGWLARLLGRKPVSIRLADARARYGLPRYRAHHAPTDALATGELLQAQIAHRFAPDTPLAQLWQ